MQEQPASVSREAGARQVGERPAWVEASVWTERMLAALDNGVKGGIWFSLSDKVRHLPNLWSAWAKVARNQGAAGADGITIQQYERDVEANLKWLSEKLRLGEYRPGPIRRAWIPKGAGKLRPLGIPAIRDRIVQGALRHVIEPIFEKQFAARSYGFRPGKGCKDALRRVDELVRGGFRYVVDADLKSYFDTIPHQRLMQEVARRVADGPVLALIRSFLETKIMEGLEQWTPEAGAPQGAVLSPLLSNIYLDPLDHEMASAGHEMVRYADDFVILCRTREQAEAALETVRRWTAQAGLSLHPEKTRIADAATDGFEFRKRPRNKSVKKLREAIRDRTPRRCGQSLERIIVSVNPVLRGWFGYFKHGPRHEFQQVDGWVRMRLRSILRKRQRLRGRGRGSDHQRWPNAFFAALELYSLQGAHRVACRSMKMVH